MLRIPAFTIPAPIGRLAARLPQTPPAVALVTALNLGLGRVIPRQALDDLIGKQLMLVVKDAGLSLRFTLGRLGFMPSFDPREPDLRISATARDFLALALREEDPDTLFFSRRLLMEGDTDLGLLVKNTLDAVELPKLDAASLSPRRLFDRLLFSGTRT